MQIITEQEFSQAMLDDPASTIILIIMKNDTHGHTEGNLRKLLDVDCEEKDPVGLRPR